MLCLQLQCTIGLQPWSVMGWVKLKLSAAVLGRDWGLHYRVGGAKYNRADCSVMGPWPWFNTFWSKVEAEWSIC